MALAMVVGLVVGYAWSVRLLYRQGLHEPRLLATAPAAAAKVTELRARPFARPDDLRTRTAARRGA